MMIILGWIGILLVLTSFIAWVSKERWETLWESFVKTLTLATFIIAFIGLIILLAVGILKMIYLTFPERTQRVDTPTLLVCNDVRVAESVDGFYYDSKGSAYKDYRNNLTYTPRQGEVCKEYLKESKQ
jgi:hypothetical protein